MYIITINVIQSQEGKGKIVNSNCETNVT